MEYYNIWEFVTGIQFQIKYSILYETIIEEVQYDGYQTCWFV